MLKIKLYRDGEYSISFKQEKEENRKFYDRRKFQTLTHKNGVQTLYVT